MLITVKPRIEAPGFYQCNLLWPPACIRDPAFMRDPASINTRQVISFSYISPEQHF